MADQSSLNLNKTINSKHSRTSRLGEFFDHPIPDDIVFSDKADLKYQDSDVTSKSNKTRNIDEFNGSEFSSLNTHQQQ